MESILISVIVPVYNVESYISKTIESILAQTYKNIEIILVDDGAKDNSGKICDEYAQKDNRIKVIHKENGGLSSARNAGMKIMQGEYVCFVDSDDWVSPNFVERMLACISKSNTDMGSCRFCETTGTEESVCDQETDPRIIADDKFYCALTEDSYAGFAWNKIFKTSIIKDRSLCFDEKIFNGEDLPFVVEYLKHCVKTSFLDERLYYYYIRPGSITTTVKLTKRYVTIVYAREKVLSVITAYAPQYEDIVLYGYLSHLIKIKYMLKNYKKEHRDYYKEICCKINKYKGRILFFKNVSIKSRIKLFLMVYFPNIFGTVYRKIKVN